MSGTTPQPERPTPEQVAIWQRRLASQANNRAWDLAEKPDRNPSDNDEMLDAAHAAAFFWNIVGDAKNRAHAALLLAHVHGLLGSGPQGRAYLAKAWQYFGNAAMEPWERATTHMIEANVAHASGDAKAHRTHYERAAHAIENLPDAQTRQLLGISLRLIPAPTGKS